MNDANLLVFGCLVSFIALAGAYVYIRQRYSARSVEERLPARTETRELTRVA